MSLFDLAKRGAVKRSLAKEGRGGGVALKALKIPDPV